MFKKSVQRIQINIIRIFIKNLEKNPVYIFGKIENKKSKFSYLIYQRVSNQQSNNRVKNMFLKFIKKKLGNF